MLSLPDDYKLIEFFEAEPELLDGEAKPWIYNELKFTTIRGKDKLIVTIYPSFGELTINWVKSGEQLIKLKFIELDSLYVEIQKNDEFLSAVGIVLGQSMLLKLRLKPNISIEVSQEYSSRL